ncbi:MAG TPA: glycosyl hydrolase family 28 protein [Opitutaceae bacterium]|nr:glycosyl hydrolase family 28 protein [Opitutaceae bacterium]
MRHDLLAGCAVVALALGVPFFGRAAVFDVKAYGARADGKALDRDAINQAVEAAAAAGGGTVDFPAGTYLTGTILLRSNVTLQFDKGSHLVASAETKNYDPSLTCLIAGENVENISIVGEGLISGTNALTRQQRAGTMDPDKAIALKSCRNVTLRDFSVLSGGHSCVWLLGVDNLTIDNVKVDTNRDGIDVDSCRNVRISNTSVNSPNDDGICLKASLGLGFPRATENVTITNCLVSGYDIGSLLDATYKRTVTSVPDRDGPTGRIKMGTGGEGGFKNITITNIVFDRCRGLALESVDGGALEDITISNITMRDVWNSPLFIRLGNRQRSPTGTTPVGTARRVTISNIVAYDADPRYPSIITGIPGHDVEDIKISDVRILCRGGLTLDQAAKQPADMASTFFASPRRGSPVPSREAFDVPEREGEYPEPSMFGVLPAYGFFIRHAKGIELNNVEIGFIKEDRRPAFVLDDVSGADFQHVKAQKAGGVPTLWLRKVENLTTRACTPWPDMKLPQVDKREL